jgi:hypothetical protein
VVGEQHQAHAIDDHHHGRLAARHLAQDLRLALVGMTGGVHRLLVERCRHHGVDVTRQRQSSRLLGPAHGGVAVARVHLAPAVRRHVDGGVVEDVDGPRRATRLPHRVDPPDRETRTRRVHRALEHAGVADDQRHAPLGGVRVRERLDGDLGSDAGGITHGDRDARTTVHWLTP